MTRVIHTGDTHVGYQQYHSPDRRRDFLRAFEAVVDDAVEEGVDAVVHAGDLFHDRRPELPDLLGVLSALRTLNDADVPFLAVVGNHETTRGGEWLDLFEEMGLATRLGADPVVVGDTAFYGLDWVPKSRREALDYEFTPHDQPHAALVAHGLFTPFAHADWETETVLSASNVAFDAMLLGDNHVPDRAEVDGTWVTYCGSTERASASERDARGYNLVSFADRASGDGSVDIRRRSLDTREFVFVTVDLGPNEGVERARERVREHDLDDAVAIVELTGEGEPIPPASVEEAGEEEGALIVRVTDRREVEETEGELSVSFADPDDAVRERVADLGLSSAARDVEETVRASKTADTNVRDAVRERVESLVAEEDLGAFESGSESTDEGTDADGGAGEGGDPDGDGDDATEPDDTVVDSGDEGQPTTDGDSETDPTADSDAEAPKAEADDDGQVSMEDYL